jgi:hypothetical protein
MIMTVRRNQPSGPGARPMDLEWAREIVKQCRWNGIVPFAK